MRKATFILFLVVFGGVDLTCKAQNANSPESQKTEGHDSQKTESPESLIRRIYDNHLSRISRNNEGLFSASNPEAYQKILADYFDEELTGLLVEDFKCQEREGGICNLDFDPIIAAQDYEEDEIKSTLKIKKIKSAPNSSSVEVTFINVKPVKLIYQLRLTDHGWRVSDIIYTDPDFSLKDSLREK